MTQKSYAKHITVISLISVVALIFIFALVVHHRDVPGRIQQDRSTLLSERSSVTDRIRPVSQVNVASAEPAKAAAPAPANAAAAAPPGERDGQQIYQSACGVCHQAGVAGAPKFGDRAAWAPRIELGIETLYASSLKGKGAMPPKGGQTALSDVEIKAAVDYMVAQSK
jgi:cytochrome c5